MPSWADVKGILGMDRDPSDFITDPSEANDSLVEDAIVKFQEAAKEVTDKLAEVSAMHADSLELLVKYREAVSEAYVELLDGKADKAKETLAKVVNK